MKQKLEEHEKERELKMKEWKRRDKELSKKQYSYLISQKRYEEEIVLPELEKYKQDLKKKKDFYKPIDIKEIKEHEKKYHRLLREKINEK